MGGRAGAMVSLLAWAACATDPDVVAAFEGFKREPILLDVAWPSLDEGLEYRWEVVTKPPASSPRLRLPGLIAGGRIPVLTVDRSGRYVVSATFGRGATTVTAGYVVVDVEHRAPTLETSTHHAVELGRSIALDAYVTNPDQGPLRVAWSVEVRPGESSAEIEAGDPLRGAFTPDVVGVYRISLEVRDEEEAVARASVRIDVTEPAQVAPGVGYYAAAYSETLDRLVLLRSEAGSNTAFIYDPAAGTGTEVLLLGPAHDLSISADGRYAAMLYSGAIGMVDLEERRHRALAASRSWRSLAMANADLGHLATGSDRIHRVDLTDGSTVRSEDPVGAELVRHSPGEDAVYGVNGGINKWSTAGPTTEFLHGLAPEAVGETCDALFLVGGEQLVTGTGTRFTTSREQSADLRPLPPLEGERCITSASTSGGVLAVTRDERPGSGRRPSVYLHDPETGALLDLFHSPDVAIEGLRRPTVPRLVGLRGTSYVLVSSVGTGSSARFVVIQGRSDPP